MTKSSNPYRREVTRKLLQHDDPYDLDSLSSLIISNVFKDGRSSINAAGDLGDYGRPTTTYAPRLRVTTDVV